MIIKKIIFKYFQSENLIEQKSLKKININKKNKNYI